MNNQFEINHAFPGLCSLCHKEVAEYDGSRNGKPIISRYLANYFGLIVTLDDNSLMTITLCNDCANTLTSKDYKKLIKSEIDGWEYELTHCLKSWTNEQKDAYRNVYYKRTIKNHSSDKKKRRRKKNGSSF